MTGKTLQQLSSAELRSECSARGLSVSGSKSDVYVRLEEHLRESGLVPENVRYLATGLAFRQIALTFRISKTAVSSIVIEICKAIWKILKEKHMPTPTIADFEKIAQEFYENWNFPNCVGSIDGKHIRIKCPKKSGSMFFNYKQFYSIVLMAVADANYKFIMTDVGSYGKDSDGAFPLRTYMMRPYPRRLLNDENKSYFNYRLSRARMTIECAFDIAAAKFRILQKSIETKVDNADHIVKAICMLHNVIIDLEKKE
ncbi:uncharacterized protein LOC115034900 [Acyrthosiphon pisum]|uniref:SAP domain-containing protein n=1 Tax=Acyrthosiphon pisum TaxID=7029 RepID=A0A8R2NU51_ACYPI|nr:uncharacterized protein LOC115034900 [Acyrthosiphon pisum]